MCGRYVRRSDKQRIAEHFHVYGPSVPDFGPSWNVAPQTFQPVVSLNRDTREREIVMMRWGLIPYWAKDPQIGLSTINAKAETVATALIPRSIQAKAMSGSGRRLPGMAEDRCQDQETLRYRIEIW
jgi:putative SOS response-associated peptidase YedK